MARTLRHGLLSLTWQVEECVEDIKALGVVSLDELVGVAFTDLWAGKHRRRDLIGRMVECLCHVWEMDVRNTHPRRKLNPWTQTRMLP